MDKIRHPTLIYPWWNNGGILGIDTWEDISCSEKHDFVDKFIESKTVTITGFIVYLGGLKDPTIANVLYVYDTIDGTTIRLEHNNTIYLGDHIEDSLGDPIK